MKCLVYFACCCVKCGALPEENESLRPLVPASISASTRFEGMNFWGSLFAGRRGPRSQWHAVYSASGQSPCGDSVLSLSAHTGGAAEATKGWCRGQCQLCQLEGRGPPGPRTWAQTQTHSPTHGLVPRIYRDTFKSGQNNTFSSFCPSLRCCVGTPECLAARGRV